MLVYSMTALFRDKPLIVILITALAARVVGMWALGERVFPDTATYFNAGKGLFATGQIGSNFTMPVYPIIAYLSGGGLGLQIADIVLSVGTVWIVYHLSLAAFVNRLAALTAAAMAAIYPFFIFYATSRLSENLFIFLLCAGFLLLYRNRFFWAGVVFVVSILTRPSIDLLVPLLIIVFSVFIHRQGGLRTLRHLVVYGIVYGALMSPWWVHNYERYGEFVRLSTSDGMVFYLGNNPMNKTGGGIINGLPTDDANLSQFSSISNTLDRNRAMKRAAIDYIVENPGRFVELAGLKFVRFWRLWPYASEYNSPIHVIGSLLSYGVVLALSIFFILRHGLSMWRPVLPMVLWIGYLSAIHMILIGSIRYRLPVEPFLIIMAGWVFSGWLGRWPATRTWLSKIEPGLNPPAG